MGIFNKLPNIQLDDSDFEELKMRALSEFGYPSVSVEITENNLVMAIKKAVDVLNIYAPRIVYPRFQIFPMKSDYELADYPKINSVVDIYLDINYLIGMGIPWEVLMRQPLSLAAKSDITVMTDYITNFLQYDTVNKAFGLDLAKELIEPNIVRITPTPMYQGLVAAKLAVPHTEDLSSLNSYEINWFIQFVQCKVAKMLARIRGKFSGVQLAVGSLDNDASTLLQEADEKEKELIEELKARYKFPESTLLIG